MIRLSSGVGRIGYVDRGPDVVGHANECQLQVARCEKPEPGFRCHGRHRETRLVEPGDEREIRHVQRRGRNHRERLATAYRSAIPARVLIGQSVGVAEVGLAGDTPSVAVDDRIVLGSGMTFHVRSHGPADGEPLVFLHGVLAAAVSYDALCEGLGRNRRVIAIDQRGHGETDHAADYDWQRWVEDLALVIESLDLGTIDLVGHSMGAGHAARFAALHPGAVRRLALVEGGFGPSNSPSEPDYWSRVARLFPPDGFASVDDYIDLAAELFPRADAAILAGSASNFRCGEDARWSWPQQADMAVVTGAWAVPTPEREKELRQSVDCPTLVAKAERSELFTGDTYLRVATEFPRGEHLLLPDIGQMVMWEGVADTVDSLNAFLS